MTTKMRTTIRVIASLAAFSVGAALGGCGGRVEAKGVPAAAARPAATVALPVRQTVTEYTEHTGNLEAPESVEIRPRVSGAIVRASFREGDLVKKDQLLFVIDPRPFEVAESRAKADLASVRADLELARKNFERAKKLVADNAIPQRDFDTQSAALDQLGAREQGAMAALASVRLDLEYAHIRSPIGGRIGRKLVTVGNQVSPSTPSALATVVSVDPLYAYVELEETRGQELDRGKAMTVELGFAGETGYPHHARVDFIDNHVDTSSGTVKVRAVIANHEGRLTQGLFVRMRVPRGTIQDALLVADRAVSTDQQHRFVLVVDQGEKVQYRMVQLGQIVDGLRVVEKGLEPNDRVVVRGLQRLRPGALVSPQLMAMRDADTGKE
jgi:multidrug efflux system membrane fusion protein